MKKSKKLKKGKAAEPVEKETTWSVPRKELEDALKIVLAVPPRNGLSCSEFIRVTPFSANSAILHLSSDMSACAYIIGSTDYLMGDMYLDRRLFEPFVVGGKESKASEYLFKKKGEVLTVKHGVRTAVYGKHKAASGYTEIPMYKNSKKVELDTSWTDILKCAISCATNDPVTPQLNCVYTAPNEKGVKVYASNTKVVFQGHVRSKKIMKEAIAFPLLLASLISDANMVELIWDDKSAMLSSPKGQMWQPVKIEAHKSFPYKAIDKLVADGAMGSPLFIANSESLSAAANRIAGYLSAVTREDLLLKMEVKAGEKKMRLVSGTGYTVFSEVVAMVKPSDIDHTVEWPFDEVLPVLMYSQKEGDAKVFITDTGRTMYKTKHINLVIARKEGK